MHVSLRPGARGASIRAIVPLLALCAAALAQAPAPEEPVPRAGSADLTTLREWSARAERPLAAIAEEEARNGPHSRRLIDPLTTLGLVHQEHGQHDEAVAALERALQIKRINDGLYNLEQAPMIRQLIANEWARGNLGAVAELENRLVELAWRHPDDARSVSIFHAAAVRHVAQYERIRSEGLPPQLTMTFNSDVGGAPSVGDPSSQPVFGLRLARRNYMTAIQSILRSGNYAHEDLIELEKGLLHTYYLQMTEDDTARVGAPLYYLGRESYRRRIAYVGLNSGTTLDFGRALVDLADWDLLFSRNAKALGQYAEARALLVAAGTPDASLREIFAAETPVLLPAFVPNPLAAGASETATAHIDVSFELSKYGVSRKIEILETTGRGTDESAKTLVRLIGASRFRPRLTGSESANSEPYRLRYYVGP